MIKLKLNSCFLILFILSIISTDANCQTMNDFQLGLGLNQSKTATSSFSPFKETTKDNKNEIDLITSGLFYIYKTVFSTQDISGCFFHPSCSVYTIQSLKKNGLILGTMQSFDRLTRCHGLSVRDYEIDIKAMKLKDPVE